MEIEVTLPKVLTQFGLLTERDNKITELKKLTPEDRTWLCERFKVEHGINVHRSAL